MMKEVEVVCPTISSDFFKFKMSNFIKVLESDRVGLFATDLTVHRQF